MLQVAVLAVEAAICELHSLVVADLGARAHGGVILQVGRRKAISEITSNNGLDVHDSSSHLVRFTSRGCMILLNPIITEICVFYFMWLLLQLYPHLP